MKIFQSTFSKRIYPMLGLALIIGTTQNCAPRPVYRTPLPPGSPPASSPKAPPAAAPAPVEEPPRTPLPQESKIREQELRTRTPVAPPAVKETAKPPLGAPPESTPGPLPDDSSLLAKITPGTSPQR